MGLLRNFMFLLGQYLIIYKVESSGTYKVIFKNFRHVLNTNFDINLVNKYFFRKTFS